jgi:DNA-binding NtrC family response regulator
MTAPVLRLAVVAGPDDGALFDVPAAGGTVGRAAASLIKLTDPAVSRGHGRLLPGDDGLIWHEDDARHPALLNGAPAAGRPLRIGDQLTVGRTRLVALAPDGTSALVGEHGPRITAELSAHDLSGARGRPDLAALIALGDALIAARDRVDAARAAAAVVCQHLRADRVDVVALVNGHPEVLASEGRSAATETAVRLPRAVLERARTGGVGVTFEDDAGRPALVVPFAGAGADAGGDGDHGVAPGVVHVARVARFGPGELELAVAAGRLIGGLLAARGAHDEAVRRGHALEDRLGGAPRILGASAAAEAVRRFVRKVGPADTTVLLVGESGTGKELVSSAIHHASRRAGAPFVAVNCAALTDTLVESELFGHEKGAFTGATERKAGRFELADGGTLLLDEVGELPPRSQAKLLRVLEDRRVDRVGGTRPLSVDVRVIAATNRDLEAMVSAGQFREDLYFRLSVIQFRLPPLRERAEDIPELAEHFLAALRGRAGRAVRGFTDQALAAMRAHGWRGNVRELRNAVERAVVLGDGDRIGADELVPTVMAPPPTAAAGSPPSMRDSERAAIVAALAAAGGNKVKAAASLGIDRTTLYKKLRVYRL